MLAVLGRQGSEDQPVPTHRAPAITAADQPAAIAPVGVADRPDSLRWSAVSGADLYRVTLFRADGRVLYEAQLRDTAAALADSVGLIAGSSYLWTVEARTGWDRWTSSRLFRFSVAGERAR
jgi:hypothetical protein